MNERPIIFSAPMVGAILDGRKTQTRRIVKPQPLAVAAPFHPEPRGGNRWVWMARDDAPGYSYATADFRCPCGAPSDRLWVREGFMPAPMEPPKQGESRWHIAYAAGGFLEANAPAGYNPMLYNYERWTPSIHMPRWASRITLEIVAVRVERLQEITEADAIAEGVESDDYLDRQEHFDSVAPPGSSGRPHPVTEFARLWDSINAKRAPWSSNPWVWVIEFRVIEREARG